MIDFKYSFIYFFAIFVVLVAGGEFDNEVDDCPASSDINRCIWWKNELGNLSMHFSHFKRPIHSKDIRCCDNNSTGKKFSRKNQKFVTELLITNNDLGSLDFGLFANFTNVESLNISRSNIVNISWENCPMTNIKTIDFSFNGIINITENVFLCNSNLSILNMRGNSWTCSSFLGWFIDWVRDKEKKGLQVLDKNSTYCTKYYWSNRMGHESLWDIVNSCPGPCSCSYRHAYTAIVNCTGQNLTDFPQKIVKDTRYLIMNNNKIKNLHKLINDSSYWGISQLELRDNQIESLNELDNVLRYMINLTTLALDGNRIEQIQAHILKKKDKLTYLKLGRNPWDCDCVSATTLRKILTSYINDIKDKENIMCSASDPKHANKLVQDLSDSALCHVEQSDIHFLDVISALAALLIIILLAKLIYDGLHFKRKGKLPLGPKAFFIEWKKNRKEKKYRKSLDSERESIANNSSA